ncbi:MAG: tetratricopeptide repeat protein, partial [Anaerolineae bacterium]|nr:tetratricopeptide repeat protein [Anaerolineae bacterium]
GEALSLTNLGLVHTHLREYQTAREKCEQALAIQRDIGDRSTEGYSLTYLGHALAGLGEFEAAAQVYQEAMALRRELGERSAAIDDLAGLARMALVQNQLEKARSHVEEILAWLDENGTGGIEYPLQVYLTCYQVLQATSNGVVKAQAQAILTKAHTRLLERAGGISDPDLRRSFLENVAANREIIELWTVVND